MVVVGGGPGGYSAAFRCAELGLETVVVDAAAAPRRRLPLRGLHPVARRCCTWPHVIARGRARAELGVEFGAPRISLDPLRKWKAERVVGKLARGLAAVAKGKGVEVVGGRGVFEDSRELRVEGETPRKIRFEHAIVATGSRPAACPACTRSSERVMDSTAALELADVPERLLVIGGGYIGLELGQVYATLGSRVTLVEMTDGLLPGVDRDLVQPLARRVERLFAAMHLGTQVTALREIGAEVEAELGAGAPERFDRVLVAVGRRAQSEGLGLETTRVAPDERGASSRWTSAAAPTTRASTRSATSPASRCSPTARCARARSPPRSSPGGPAAFDNVGDARGGLHRSRGRLVRPRARRRPRAAGARSRSRNSQWAASGRAATLGRAGRAHQARRRRRHPAASSASGIVGPGAGELIAEAALAVETALAREDVAATIHAHPTLSEGLMEAAEHLLGA